MEKRVIIALVLSLIILIGYPFLFLDDKKSNTKQDIKSKTPPTQTEVVSPKEAPPTPLAPVRILEGTGKEEILSVETSLYKIELSTRGGGITRWELKQFKDEKKTNNIVLFPTTSKLAASPLAIVTPDQELNQFLSNGIYYHRGGETMRLDPSHPEATLTLTLFDPVQGRGMEKTLTFHDASYLVDLSVTPFGFKTAYTLSLGSNFGIRDWGDQMMIGYAGPSTLMGEDLVKDKPGKIEGEVFHQAPVTWTALNDKYFIGALIPRGNVEGVVVKKHKEKDVEAGLRLPGGGTSTVSFYGGPKEYEHLKATGVELNRTIEFGWFLFGDWAPIRWIAKTLFHGLQLVYEYTQNYGIAIILLTVFIKILFVPLTHKSYKSMKAMQNLQPEIQKLQKKFKDDKQRLNRELIEVYKTHKVNPLGGCLPILLQIPVFIGLFNLLNSTAKIMLILPVIFTFFFLSFPAGLVLYWLVNNVLTIAQQYITMKYLTPAKSGKSKK
ncbi:MAG: membrane protein insertase YidC [Nitrospirae bacterium]|nr:membrane protein insertase YidC [Nitrospirota bacterium]